MKPLELLWRGSWIWASRVSPHPFLSLSLSHSGSLSGIKSYLSSLLNLTSFLVSHLKMKMKLTLTAEQTRRDLCWYSTEFIQIMQKVRHVFIFPPKFFPSWLNWGCDMAQSLCCLEENGHHVVTGVITTFSGQENWVAPSLIMFH